MAAGGLECVQGVLYICQLYLLHHLQFAGAKLLLPLREGLKDEIKFVCVCVGEGFLCFNRRHGSLFRF